MTPIRVRRWTKGPHDRLYVSTAGGTKVGWYDLRTQRHHLDVPGMWPQFQQAVVGWRAAHPGTGPGPAAVGVPTPPAGHPEDRGTARQRRRQRDTTLTDAAEPDLAERRAGHNVAAMADRLAPGPRPVRLLARLLGVRTRDRSWRIGAAGERAVGAHLDPLARRGWRILHAIVLGAGGGDLDHLLIGPFGVFTVNTKHHPRAVVLVDDRTMRVRGRRQPYIDKACREAARVRQALTAAAGRPVHVAPLVVVHGHRRLHGWLTHRPQGVQVLPSRAVAWWCRLPGRAALTADEIDHLYTLARRPATWRRC